MAFNQEFKLIGEDCESLIKDFYGQISTTEKFKKCLDEINKTSYIMREGCGGNMTSTRGCDNTGYVRYTYARDSISWGGHKLYIDRQRGNFIKIHYDIENLETTDVDYTKTGHLVFCHDDPSKSKQYIDNPFYLEADIDFFIQRRKVYVEETK